MKPLSPFRSGSGGFTLVEVLTAIVILSMLALLVGEILNSVGGTWSQVSAQIDREQNARSVLNLIANDLAPTALPLDRTNTSSLQLLVDPVTLIGASSGVTGTTRRLSQCPRHFLAGADRDGQCRGRGWLRQDGGSGLFRPLGDGRGGQSAGDSLPHAR
ncbi:MAG: prepilin-type N-terminal cleavage/methylation domain-containing protein [Verrucomicrobiota bacterium]